MIYHYPEPLVPCEEWFSQAMWMFLNPFASENAKRIVYGIMEKEGFTR
jgi:hypothetical protein